MLYYNPNFQFKNMKINKNKNRKIEKQSLLSLALIARIGNVKNPYRMLFLTSFILS